MKLASRVGQGAYAGVSGGIAIAVFFLVGDLIHLSPLSTPLALGYTFLGPAGTPLDLPVVAQILTVGSAGVRLVAFTAIHFATFAVLGVAAVFLFSAYGWKLNLGTGALFGLVACSIVFYAAVSLAGSGVVAELPGLWSVASGNLLAGAVIGGQAQVLRRSD